MAAVQTAFPHLRSSVPEACRPWLYVFIACCFQLSGARYLGALNALVGAHGNMREDIMMCVFANLSGMAIWFPMLFRMKFRFSNKALLAAASLTVVVTNLLTMYVTALPLLWFCCFVEGIAKIQGTFECMSNIQLWLTPKRDMKVFFPCLHVIILSAMCAQTLLSAYFGYIGCWQLMHWLVIGLHGVVLLLLACFWRQWLMPRTPMGQPTPIPLRDVDWLGCLLWGCLLLEVAMLLTYGEFYDWYRQDATWLLSGGVLVTLGLIVARMFRAGKPYISPKVFTRFRYVKAIFLLIVLYEAVFGHGACVGGTFQRACAWLRHADECATRLGGMGGQCGRVLVQPDVDEARSALHLHPLGHYRHLRRISVCRADVFSRYARAQYGGVVSAAFLPWICVRLHEHHVHGRLARFDGFRTFLYGLDGLQCPPHGHRRLCRHKHLWTSA